MRNVIFKRVISVSLACFLVAISTHNALLQVFASETGVGDSGSIPYSDPVTTADGLIDPAPIQESNPAVPDAILAVPNTDTDNAVKEANIVFSFSEGTQYIDPAQYVQDQRDAILLNGVSAVDENGVALADFRIQDYGGFNIDNPGSGQAFTITYAATHSVTQKVFTATRDVYVSIGVVAAQARLAPVSTWDELKARVLEAADGDVIPIACDIPAGAGTAITITDKKLTFESAVEGQAVTLNARTGGTTTSYRHFTVYGAHPELIFRNVILDGNGQVGGIQCFATDYTITGAVIQNCTSPTSSGMTNGGAISKDSGKGKLNIIDCKLLNNNARASSGGAIYANSSCTGVNIIGSTITGNKALSGCGGAIQLYGNLLVSDSEISYNEADGRGAIYTIGSVHILNSKMIGNKLAGTVPLGNSYKDGAAIQVWMSSGDPIVTIENSLMQDNEGAQGGVVYTMGKVKVINSELINNKAHVAGGAISCGGTMTVTDSTFTNNTAVYSGIGSSSGGAILFWGDKLTLSGSTFRNNTADGSGGAICAYRTTCNITISSDSTFIGNHAYGNGSQDGGGAIEIATLNNLTIDAGATFSGNTAKTPRWMENPNAGENTAPDIATHGLCISTDSRSAPPDGNQNFTYLYNNYDVFYSNGATENPKATTYTVQFESNGGTPVPPLTNVPAGSTITRPPNPAREKYEFMYWYKDPALTQRWNFNTDTVTDNITLYARWEWTGEIIPGQ